MSAPRIVIIEYGPSGVDAAYRAAMDRLDQACRDPHSKLYNTPDPGGHERAAHAHNNALVDDMVKNTPPSDVPNGKRVI